MTITRLFILFLNRICLICHSFFDKSEILRFKKCGCTNCDKCLAKKIKRCTNGLILLSSYEKYLYYKNPIVDNCTPFSVCTCLEPFDLDVAIEKVYKNKMAELENNVSMRLNSIVLITCYECFGQVNLLKVPNNFEYISITSDYHKIFVNVEEENKRNGRNTHLVCHKCFQTNKSMKKEKNRMSIYCKICELTHYVDPKEVKRLKTKHNACCNIF